MIILGLVVGTRPVDGDVDVDAFIHIGNHDSLEEAAMMTEAKAAVAQPATRFDKASCRVMTIEAMRELLEAEGYLVVQDGQVADDGLTCIECGFPMTIEEDHFNVGLCDHCANCTGDDPGECLRCKAAEVMRARKEMSHGLQ